MASRLTPVLAWDGEAAHLVTVEDVSEAKVQLLCGCGWSRGCRRVNVRRWANAHWRSIGRAFVVDPREDCPVCGRRKALAVALADGHAVSYCKWARSGLCAWPGPVPPIPETPPCREVVPEPLRVRAARPPWRPPEDQDDAVAWMVKLRDEGYSLAAIARRLDAKGFPPPMCGGRGGRWNATTAKRWLAWHDGVTLPKWWASGG